MAYKLTKRGNKRPPTGYDYLAPTLNALEDELKLATLDSHDGKRKCEALWPIHQLNWQRTRYIYDMYKKYKRISKETYDYCCKMKLVDTALASYWSKPGYSRLCSTYAINPQNFQHGGVSICRVPQHQLRDGQIVEAIFNGCLGCADEKKSGNVNIFGNKYGQRLAVIQTMREEALGIAPPTIDDKQKSKNRKKSAAAGTSHDAEQENGGENEDDGAIAGTNKRRAKDDGAPLPRRKRVTSEDENVWAQNAQEEDAALRR